MSKPFYPNLNLGALASLATIRSQMDAHEDYLTHEDCPYEETTREQLAQLLAVRTVEVPVEKIVERIVEKKVEVVGQAAESAGKRGPKAKTSGVDLDGVAKEIQSIRDELKELKLNSKALQTADKIQIIKTRAALIEKLISMDEKTSNQRKSAHFMSIVLTILDDLVPEERRQEFMRRVEPFASAE